MLPPGSAELGLELDRRARLQARLAGGRDPQAVLDRLGQHAVQRRQRRLRSPPPWPPACSRANSRAGMCSPKQVSVCAPASRSSGPRIEGSVSEWQ